MKEKYPSGAYFIVDDYMACSYSPGGKITYSRNYIPLIFALRAGCSAVVSDIDFCHPELRDEMERVMMDAVSELAIQWLFYENDPEMCAANILRRSKEKGRNYDETITALNRLTLVYKIPSKAAIMKVYGR
ncbi:MAG: hypothetical protein JST22_16015 [Bacteroidetes bacterium]|nr:hypothetical protein [Bacteroidota bacterium]